MVADGYECMVCRWVWGEGYEVWLEGCVMGCGWCGWMVIQIHGDLPAENLSTGNGPLYTPEFLRPGGYHSRTARIPSY